MIRIAECWAAALTRAVAREVEKLRAFLPRERGEISLSARDLPPATPKRSPYLLPDPKKARS